MSNARDGFDAIGVVVDWIDACKQRRLDDLLNLYDATATVECCEGGSFRGRSEMERYWRPRLARAVTGAFEIDALFPEADGVTLDYRGYDGVPRADAFPLHKHGEDKPHRLRAYQSGRLKLPGSARRLPRQCEAYSGDDAIPLRFFCARIVDQDAIHVSGRPIAAIVPNPIFADAGHGEEARCHPLESDTWRRISFR